MSEALLRTALQTKNAKKTSLDKCGGRTIPERFRSDSAPDSNKQRLAGDGSPHRAEAQGKQQAYNNKVLVTRRVSRKRPAYNKIKPPVTSLQRACFILAILIGTCPLLWEALIYKLTVDSLRQFGERSSYPSFMFCGDSNEDAKRDERHRERTAAKRNER